MGLKYRLSKKRIGSVNFSRTFVTAAETNSCAYHISSSVDWDIRWLWLRVDTFGTATTIKVFYSGFSLYSKVPAGIRSMDVPASVIIYGITLVF